MFALEVRNIWRETADGDSWILAETLETRFELAKLLGSKGRNLRPYLPPSGGSRRQIRDLTRTAACALRLIVASCSNAFPWTRNWTNKLLWNGQKSSFSGRRRKSGGQVFLLSSTLPGFISWLRSAHALTVSKWDKFEIEVCGKKIPWPQGFVAFKIYRKLEVLPFVYLRVWLFLALGVCLLRKRNLIQD